MLFEYVMQFNIFFISSWSAPRCNWFFTWMNNISLMLKWKSTCVYKAHRCSSCQLNVSYHLHWSVIFLHSPIQPSCFFAVVAQTFARMRRNDEREAAKTQRRLAKQRKQESRRKGDFSFPARLATNFTCVVVLWIVLRYERKDILGMGIDRREKKRTHCMVKECDCTDYELPECGNECDYCGCKPTKHAVEEEDFSSFCEREPPTKRSQQQIESCCVDNTNFNNDNSYGGSFVEQENSDSGGGMEKKHYRVRAWRLNASFQYKITMEGCNVMFECSACEISNVLTYGVTKKDAHSMSNLIKHQQTDLHKFKLHVLSGKMRRENPMLCKIFDQIETVIGKNMFLLGDGHLIWRSCKGAKISLTSRGSALQRAKCHLNSKEHRKLNSAEFQKVKDIKSFFKPTKKIQAD